MAAQTVLRPKTRAGTSSKTDADARSVAVDTSEVVESPDASLAFMTSAVRERLARLGIFRLEDIVLHLPLRYEDETTVTAISDAP